MKKCFNTKSSFVKNKLREDKVIKHVKKIYPIDNLLNTKNKKLFQYRLLGIENK